MPSTGSAVQAVAVRVGDWGEDTDSVGEQPPRDAQAPIGGSFLTLSVPQLVQNRDQNLSPTGTRGDSDKFMGLYG